MNNDTLAMYISAFSAFSSFILTLFNIFINYRTSKLNNQTSLIKIKLEKLTDVSMNYYKKQYDELISIYSDFISAAYKYKNRMKDYDEFYESYSIALIAASPLHNTSEFIRDVFNLLEQDKAPSDDQFKICIDKLIREMRIELAEKTDTILEKVQMLTATNEN